MFFSFLFDFIGVFSELPCGLYDVFIVIKNHIVGESNKLNKGGRYINLSTHPNDSVCSTSIS